MDTIGELIDHNAYYLGRQEAFFFEGRRVSHAEYAGRVRKLASALYRAGLRRGDRVAMLSANRYEMWELFGVAEYAGFIAAPINFRLAPAEVAYLLNDAVPKAVVFDPVYSGLAAAMRANTADAVTWIALDGGPAPDWAAPYEDFLSQGEDHVSLRASREDIVYLFYTSGTTGRPKGAMIQQKGQMAAALQTITESGLQKGGTWLSHSPLFHTGANGPRVAQQFAGGRTVLHRHFDARQTLRDIQDERINATFTVATMLEDILSVPGSEDYDLSSMTAWMVAGAPCSLELLRKAMRRLGPIFCVQYGMTEGRVSTLQRSEMRPDGDEADLRRLRSVGRPAPSVRMKIVDEEGQECPVGTPGEILFQSPNLFAGYWNNHPATIEALRDGWMHSGDIGVLDDDHYLYLVDRKKDMIISGGENIYSREVEDAISAHPDVVHAAVIGVPDERWGEAVKAYVQLIPGAKADEAAMIDHCRTLIARYKCPKYVAFVDALPLVGSGKIDKPALRSWEKDKAG